MKLNLTADGVLSAHEALKENVTQTPLIRDRFLSDKYDAEIYLKREDLQIVRSFKLRGAYYAIDQLTDEESGNGVICASAGNHAQGVAYTCNLKGIQATIFMPKTTPKQKIDQVKYFGGENVTIMIEGDTFDQSNTAAHIYAEENNLHFVEPFNDENVILGQGTVGVEIQQELASKELEADYVLVPIGGGGLISGISTYINGTDTKTEVIGVEPSGAASMQAAIQAGLPVELEDVNKFADGTSVAKVGEKTYNQVKEYVERFISVPEGHLAQTILDMYSKQAIVAEPSGALSVAALDFFKEEIKGKTVVAVISGGNNDISRMGEIEERAMVYRNLQHYFVIKFPQRAGALKQFVSDILTEDDDITRFEYTKRTNRSQGPVFVGILLGKEENLPGLIERLEQFDPNYINVTKNPTLYQLMV